MRLDKLGRPLAHDIRVSRGWKPANSIWLPHELIWLEAALTLPLIAKMFAYRDISVMSGKSVDQVKSKAHVIGAARKASEALKVAAE